MATLIPLTLDADLAFRVRKWASGNLPAMTAADIICTTGLGPILDGNNRIDPETGYPDVGGYLVDVDAGTAFASGAELALARVCASLLAQPDHRTVLDLGDLWRLDSRHRAAVLTAFTDHLGS